MTFLHRPCGQRFHRYIGQSISISFGILYPFFQVAIVFATVDKFKASACFDKLSNGLIMIALSQLQSQLNNKSHILRTFWPALCQSLAESRGQANQFFALLAIFARYVDGPSIDMKELWETSVKPMIQECAKQMKERELDWVKGKLRIFKTGLNHYDPGNMHLFHKNAATINILKPLWAFLMVLMYHIYVHTGWDRNISLIIAFLAFEPITCLWCVKQEYQWSCAHRICCKISKPHKHRNANILQRVSKEAYREILKIIMARIELRNLDSQAPALKKLHVALFNGVEITSYIVEVLCNMKDTFYGQQLLAFCINQAIMHVDNDNTQGRIIQNGVMAPKQEWTKILEVILALLQNPRKSEAPLNKGIKNPNDEVAVL